MVQGDQELQGRQRNRYMCTQGQGSSPHLSYTDTIIKILSEQIYTALRKVLSMLHHHLIKKIMTAIRFFCEIIRVEER